VHIICKEVQVNMPQRLKYILHLITPAFYVSILTVILVACDTGTSGSTSTLKPPPTPTAAPFSIYMGTGYIIRIPKGWNITNSSENTVSFKDSTGVYNMSIVVSPRLKGLASANALVDARIKVAKSQLKNWQTVAIPPKTKVGGDTWGQGSISGTTMKNGQSEIMQTVVIADIHPTSKGFIIVYGTAKSKFDQANVQYFLPMLQSFKFV
jgi:hypothetical protein